ncbi:MAG: hypothetical protein HRU20_05335 [Pseudomonadales bacterium]|nr:hypothetical protein [Pseudomonadales bacterium]
MNTNVCMFITLKKKMISIIRSYLVRNSSLSDYRQGRRCCSIGKEIPSIRVNPRIESTRNAVVCHIYYEETVDELIESIMRLGPIDCYISLVIGVSDHLEGRLNKLLPKAIIYLCNNLGRDIYPFIRLIQTGVLYQYKSVLKIHGKVSNNDPKQYKFNGEEWRKRSLRSLIPDDGIETMLEKFNAAEDIGLICPKEYIYGMEHLGLNAQLVKMLCYESQIEFDFKSFRYPAGTMFWIKADLLCTVGALKLIEGDFDKEPIEVDGTLAHALERFFGIMLASQGLKLISPEKLDAR